MDETQHDPLPGDGDRSPLGSFLRARRERLRPEQVGLAGGGRRRRAKGLRREEVAELAGIGVDWYIRLEQGRAVTPSAMTIDALARALQLSREEHAHLRALAQTGGRRRFTAEQVPPAILRMVAGLPQPAYVLGRRWDVLAWNRAAAELLGFDRLAEGERNVLVAMLTNPRVRDLFGAAWADEARRMVSEFRATHDLWAGDPAFVALITRLHDGCPEFRDWWRAHDVRTGTAGRKRFHHPKLGLRQFDHTSFQSNDDPALKLVIYTPA